MLAPSEVTSCESHLPIPTSSEPVQIIADMLCKLQIQETRSDEDEMEPDVISEANPLQASNILNEAYTVRLKNQLAAKDERQKVARKDGRAA
jgi:hypothetical protein